MIDIYSVKSTLKESAPSIFMGAGMSFGVQATIDGIKSTFKLHEDGIDKTYFEKGSDTSMQDKVKTAGKYYWKSALYLALAGCCFYGGIKGYSSKIASTATAASWIEKQYREYRDKNRELYGDEADSRIRKEVVNDHISKNPPPTKKNKDAYHIYDPITDQYFEATQLELDHCEREMNRILCKESPVRYRYLLQHFKGVNYDLPICDEVGWFLDDTYSEYHYWNESFFGRQYFEIHLDPQETQYGDIYVLRFNIEPMLALYDVDEAKDSQDEHALY